MTIDQRQCCLAALGLYPCSEIDGIWGPRSQGAWELFHTRYPGKTLGQAVVELERTGDFWSGIRYWSREEFRCRCGGKYCDGFPAEPSETLVRLLEEVRGDFGAPGIPSSGLRCQRHNAAVGGVANSRHMAGKAMDFRVEGVSGEQLLARLKADSRTRYAYIIGSGPYVHVDVD